MKNLLDIVCLNFGIKVSDFNSKYRYREFVDARRCYISIMTYVFGYSRIGLARELYLNHATIIYNLKKHNDIIETDIDYRKRYKNCFDYAVLFKKHNSLKKDFNMSKNLKTLKKKIENYKKLIE